jgi:hypothetical protein
MTIPASKVRALCSESEIAIVRASRKPELAKLSRAEVKRLAIRARKLRDKWQIVARDQSRARSRLVGATQADKNTQLKAEIFRDALDVFEARLKQLDESGAPTARKSRPKAKKERTAEHRATRAAVRKGITAAADLLNDTSRQGTTKHTKLTKNKLGR